MLFSNHSLSKRQSSTVLALSVFCYLYSCDNIEWWNFKVSVACPPPFPPWCLIWFVITFESFWIYGLVIGFENITIGVPAWHQSFYSRIVSFLSSSFLWAPPLHLWSQSVKQTTCSPLLSLHQKNVWMWTFGKHEHNLSRKYSNSLSLYISTISLRYTVCFKWSLFIFYLYITVICYVCKVIITYICDHVTTPNKCSEPCAWIFGSNLCVLLVILLNIFFWFSLETLKYKYFVLC